MNYEIKLFSKFNEELKKNWMILEKNSHHTCFNSLVWVQNYLSSYRDKKNLIELKIFVLFYKNEPVCIFPFEIIKKYKIKILQWACDLNSDYNAPVQKKNFSFQKEAFEEIWNKIVKMIPEVDIIYLKKQINYFENEDNPFINFLKNSEEGSIYQILLPKEWQSYTNKILKKKFYLDLMRTKRLIKKQGKVEFIIAKNSQEKRDFLDILINQKKESLVKGNNESFSEKDLNFYKNFEKYEYKHYNTQVSAIKLNGEFIAMHWGIVNQNYYYYLIPSMKEESFKKFSPGKLLLSLLIRWSISKRIKIFDFGLGEELYKSKWSNKKKNIYNYIKLKNLKGIFFYIILKIRQSIKKKKSFN